MHSRTHYQHVCACDPGAVGDLARRFGLGAEMISSLLLERVGGVIRGRMESGVIYTQAYLTRIKAQLRWAAGGCRQGERAGWVGGGWVPAGWAGGEMATIGWVGCLARRRADRA